MDAWATGTQLLSDGLGSGLLNFNDPILGKVLTAKKGLQLALETGLLDGQDDLSKLLIEMLISTCDGDMVTVESLLRSHPELVNQRYPETKGITGLIYGVAFNNKSIVESLLQNHDADVDMNDTIVYYTPLMWAVYLNQLDMVKLLLNYQADPYKSPKDDDKNAVSLVSGENLAIYEYFKSHNLLETSKVEDDGYFKVDNFGEDPVDDLSTQIKLQSITDDSYEVEAYGNDSVAVQEDDESYLSTDLDLVHLKEFDYDKLNPNQFIEFLDSDIPSILDYLFQIRTNQIQFQHDTKLPAAIVFQCIRYSHLKVNSEELTEFLFESFVARLRSITNTKSGVFNMATVETPGDIVLISYWLSVLQFLHFYMTKNDIYQAFPKFLQELINLFQSLIVALSFSINTRLDSLVDDCLLNFTNLVDVSNTLYAKDWNFFKNNKSHPNTFDDVQKMLYPPKDNELMKPSPIRYIQVLGALDYVLRIHKVDNLVRLQAFSQVFYYSNAIIFNRIISQSKYCSRSKAIQIRLNISAIEDWLRSHDFKITKLNIIGGLDGLISKNEDFKLDNLLQENWTQDKQCDDTHYLEFYYNSLYFIGKTQLQPTIEILQWLQCMTLLSDEESLIYTINQFDTLNYYQLYKVINKLYKYEVSEKKLPKKFTNLIKQLMNQEGENQIARLSAHYMTQSNFLNKEIYIYLNPNFIYNIALPNKPELINNYGAGLGGVRVLRAKKYQPTLPGPVQDDVDGILQDNRDQHFDQTYEYDQSPEDDDDRDTDTPPTDDYKPKDVDFKGDELFKQVQMPSSILHRNWGENNASEFESNPW